MTNERHDSPAEQERSIRKSIRTMGDACADTAFRARLKREFIDGTITESAAPQPEHRPRWSPHWWWVLVPAAAVLLLFALLLPSPAPTWSVVAVAGEGQFEIEGQTLAADEPDLVARALRSGGRIRTLEQATLDLVLDDRLLLALDAGAEVTVPVLPERGTPGALISEVHHGELRIKTGPGFAGTELHIITEEGRTEIVGTVISVYKGDGYTCVCVLEGTARVGADEARLEDVPHGMLKIMFSDGSDPIVTDIAPQHEADLLEFDARYRDVFAPQE